MGGAMPPMASIVSHSLLLALVGWVTVLVMFGLWLHYGIVQIALPAAVNAVLTSFLTMWLNLLIQLPWLATLIGLLVGILVGLILCQFCRPISKATGRLPNG
jgi:ABC-type antimicrobial peptide transport system permease subunit